MNYRKELIKIKCPLCQSVKYKVLYKSTLKKEDYDFEVIKNNLKNTLDNYKKHGQIVKCLMCNLIYVNPRENINQLLKAYQEVEDQEYLATEKYRKILSGKHIKAVKKYKKRGILLDIGCFAGFFAEIAIKKGYKAYGLEPSEWASKIAKKRGIKILGKTLNDSNIKNNSFDIVTMWDVIEHLPDPANDLKIINNILKDKGIIAIGTPNIESLIAKILGGRHPYLIRMHIILFGPTTINKLLQKTGFKIIHKESYGRTYPLYYYFDRLGNSIKLFNYLSDFVKKSKTLANIKITLNLHDEFLVIAKKVK